MDTSSYFLKFEACDKERAGCSEELRVRRGATTASTSMSKLVLNGAKSCELGEIWEFIVGRG